MTDERAEMSAARTAGLRVRNETREARAIRRQIAEEIAEACLGQRIAYDGTPDDFTKGWNGCAVSLSEIARQIGAEETPS